MTWHERVGGVLPLILWIAALCVFWFAVLFWARAMDRRSPEARGQYRDRYYATGADWEFTPEGRRYRNRAFYLAVLFVVLVLLIFIIPE